MQTKPKKKKLLYPLDLFPYAQRKMDLINTEELRGRQFLFEIKKRPIKVKKLKVKFVKCFIPIIFPGNIFKNKSVIKKLTVSYNPGSISDQPTGLNLNSPKSKDLK